MSWGGVGGLPANEEAGHDCFALSPFRNEKTPSFAISPSKNIWKDFSTGKGGNAVSYLIEAEGMSYVEALKYIADKYGIALSGRNARGPCARRQPRITFRTESIRREVVQQAAPFRAGRAECGLGLFQGTRTARQHDRGVPTGVFPDEWEAFSKEALKNKFQEEYLLKTGLVSKSEKDGRLFDRFRGRIIFPIHNHLGKVAGFGGRILKKDEKAAKYINFQESEVYHKSFVLFGLHHAKKAIATSTAPCWWKATWTW